MDDCYSYLRLSLSSQFTSLQSLLKSGHLTTQLQAGFQRSSTFILQNLAETNVGILKVYLQITSCNFLMPFGECPARSISATRLIRVFAAGAAG